MSRITVVSDGGDSYCVVLRDSAPERPSQQMTWKGFLDKTTFNEWYARHANNLRFTIIMEGLSMQRALDQCLASQHQEHAIFVIQSEREALARAFSR